MFAVAAFVMAAASFAAGCLTGALFWRAWTRADAEDARETD